MGRHHACDTSNNRAPRAEGIARPRHRRRRPRLPGRDRAGGGRCRHHRPDRSRPGRGLQPASPAALHGRRHRRPKVEAAAARLAGRPPRRAGRHLARPLRPRLRRAARRLRRASSTAPTRSPRSSTSTTPRSARRVPLVHAGAIGTRAQLLTVLPGQTACYSLSVRGAARRPTRCRPARRPECSGPSVVLAGSLQARGGGPPAHRRRRAVRRPPAHVRHADRRLAPRRRWRRAPRVPPAASCIGKSSRKGA